MINFTAVASARCVIPHVFLTSWHAPQDGASWGTGQRWDITGSSEQSMGASTVLALVPPRALLDELGWGSLTFRGYEQAHLKLLDLASAELAPGSLRAQDGSVLNSGDTLCCTCSVEAGSERECHRVWSAEKLLDAGWRVTLDGVRLRKRAPIFGTSGGFSRLSRSFPGSIELYERQFRSMEHFIGWVRCCVAGRPDLAAQVLEVSTTHQARDFSRKVSWSLTDEIQATAVAVITYFAQTANARADLLGTGDAKLIAPSREYGTTWGAASTAPDTGDNLYGELLMCVRALLGGSD